MTGRAAKGQKRARLGVALNRLAALRAARARPATGFVSQPEPRTIGSFARGRQLIAGNFLFAGFLIEGPGVAIWDLPMPDPAFEEALHGCIWLDDLAAVGDRAARERAQDWVFGWIERYGAGSGPGWTPDLTGRRLIRWINHAILLLNGQERAAADGFFRSLGQQTLFLSKRWRSASPGLPRFEALTGLIYAGLSLTGMERLASGATEALARECAEQIDAEGGIPTRNPEELLDVLTLLTWAKAALEAAGRKAAPEHIAAIERIVPTLRALRHSDGGLARFHGGGRGLEGRLDQALAASAVRGPMPEGLAMGFARMHGGRTSMILDAARPPLGPASANGHAATLAFELTSGRRPLVVSCGSGAIFGREWHRAGRATASHSTLAIEGFSSSRLAPAPVLGRVPSLWLDETPAEVWARRDGDEGDHVMAGHNGYAPTHGMTHVRELTLSPDGAVLKGQDTLGAMTPEDRRRFETIFARVGLRGIPFQIRFHLHPEADATLDLGGTAVSVALKSGEIWIFRHDGVAEMTLEPSVYLESGRLRPRPSQQIVLSARVLDYACQIGWTFSKAQDTPASIRDTDPDRPESDL
ncbi:heparinase II/III family protein [Sedimentimonas flavescens]|uniref:Heparinase II/III family protein n=1 Tax=Sedimentimonas flavescens TaxID=2851012 RepID=A0ABT3A0V6_9RHOB|nr:heparinase II/III family protein [Sedimentimonas flavescens]MCV2879195.1 heparinase II/III family protein [Sedimentimonas flavescens]